MRASLYLNFKEHLASIILTVCLIVLNAVSIYMFDAIKSIEIFIIIFNVTLTIEIISTYRRKSWERHLHTFPIKKESFIKAPMIIAWGHCTLLFLISIPVVFLRDGSLFDNFRGYLLFYCASIVTIAVIFYLNFRYKYREKIKGLSYFVAFVTTIVAAIGYMFVVVLLGFLPLYIVPLLFHIPLWYSYKWCVKKYKQMDII
ncbi:hypothetical protein [Ureibacillus acetophenoni]|uniref:Uncharacterized protein n=1 Tax=Ureibacillus acetophenoni TaxID=614649 RepID=A0A285U5U7_9BACL|nr:hypothetical protein [Ureibacillus acetophenoni]SOC35641.1 hypothetical protein SAMN05877842_101529 [Ureibacillus acetophenoni]